MLVVITPKEVFKSFRKKYLISNFGRVYSIAHNKFLKCYKNTEGYVMFEDTTVVNKKRKRKFWYVHITVVELFGDKFGKIRKENPKLVIDHVDGDKENNNINNLELVTQSVNVVRGYELAKLRAEQIERELFS